MKQLPLLITCLFFFGCNLLGQAPTQFNYQAVARNASGLPISNLNIKVRLSIHADNVNGSVDYSETRSVTTNAMGLFTVAIGSAGATNITGDIATMNWGAGNKFLQVEMDPSNTNAFIQMGTTQLLSVPFALHAATAGSTAGAAAGDLSGIYPNPTVVKIQGREVSPQFVDYGQSLRWDALQWKPMDGEWYPRAGIHTYYTGVGNVGIGKTAPAFKLDVSGSINTDSFYRIGSTKILSSYQNGSLFLGKNAGAFNHPSDGDNNTFVGNDAGKSNNTGKFNTFLGKGSGPSNTAGAHNCFIGNNTGYSNTTGDNNSFFGDNAGSGNTSGYNNTFLGSNAGPTIFQPGNNNTIVGAMSGSDPKIGSGNTFLGYQSDISNPNLLFDVNNSTAIGNTARITNSNQVRIGNDAVTSIGGFVGWTNLSDGRFKKNIKENVSGLEFIKKLRPVTYNFDIPRLNDFFKRTDTTVSKRETILYSGFIAQEVETAARELGFNFSGVDAPQSPADTYGLRYAEFTVPLVKAVQELAKENENLKKEIAAIKKILNK